MNPLVGLIVRSVLVGIALAIVMLAVQLVYLFRDMPHGVEAELQLAQISGVAVGAFWAGTFAFSAGFMYGRSRNKELGE